MATTEIITLKQLCAELKLDPRECRERLRAAVRDAKKFPELAKTHKSRTPWQWVKGSAGEKEARDVIKGMGDTFLRLGNKSKAVEYLKKSIATSPSTYRDQIARTLATLNDADAILLLNERFPGPSSTPPGLVARQAV